MERSFRVPGKRGVSWLRRCFVQVRRPAVLIPTDDAGRSSWPSTAPSCAGRSCSPIRRVTCHGVERFAYLPAPLSGLPPEVCTHSPAHTDLASFKRVAGYLRMEQHILQ